MVVDRYGWFILIDVKLRGMPVEVAYEV
jgi:hypothetical protein